MLTNAYPPTWVTILVSPKVRDFFLCITIYKLYILNIFLHVYYLLLYICNFHREKFSLIYLYVLLGLNLYSKNKLKLCHFSFQAALHIHSSSKHDEFSYTQHNKNSHPLDSTLTPDVLRYVKLEISYWTLGHLSHLPRKTEFH